MKQYNSKLTPLAFFKDIKEQIRFKSPTSYHTGCLIGNYNYINFQLQLPRSIGIVSVVAELYDDNDVFINDFSSNLEFKITGSSNWITNNSNNDILRTVTDNPYMYLKITVNNEVFYSDIFKMQIGTEYLCLNSIKWKNSCDMMDTIYTPFGGYTEYINEYFFGASVEKGEPFFETQEIQNGRMENKITKAVMKDTYTLTDIIPSSSVDAIMALSLHSFITYNNQECKVRSVTIEDLQNEPNIKLVSIVMQVYSDFTGGCCNNIESIDFPAPTLSNRTITVKRLTANGTTLVTDNLLLSGTGTRLKLVSVTFTDPAHSATVLNSGFTGTFDYTRPANVISNTTATFTVSDILNRTASATLTIISNP